MTKIRTVKPELFRHILLFDAEQKNRSPFVSGLDQFVDLLCTKIQQLGVHP